MLRMDLQLLVWPESGKVKLQIERRWSWCTAPCLSALSPYGPPEAVVTSPRWQGDPRTLRFKLHGRSVIVWTEVGTLFMVSFKYSSAYVCVQRYVLQGHLSRGEYCSLFTSKLCSKSTEHVINMLHSEKPFSCYCRLLCRPGFFTV